MTQPAVTIRRSRPCSGSASTQRSWNWTGSPGKSPRIGKPSTKSKMTPGGWEYRQGGSGRAE
jgi:hypothetical protein